MLTSTPGRWVLGALLALLLQTAAASTEARPQPPVDAILAAFQTHSLVALGEFHGNEQTHALRLSLLRDPRFASSVDSVVVEFGNALYQSVMDRYIAGEPVQRQDLVRVWQDTSIPHGVWDVPIYEETFRALREVNQHLAAGRRLRVLLGDPPLNWSSVHSRQDLVRWQADRDSYPARLIESEVLRKHSKALILYGAWHTDHRPHTLSDGITQSATLLSLLESKTGSRVFSVDLSTGVSTDLEAIDPSVRSWPIPSLALLQGTALGASLEQHFDAIIYLGPRATLTQARLPLELVTDPAYQLLRMTRTALALMPP